MICPVSVLKSGEPTGGNGGFCCLYVRFARSTIWLNWSTVILSFPTIARTPAPSCVLVAFVVDVELLPPPPQPATRTASTNSGARKARGLLIILGKRPGVRPPGGCPR